MSDFYTSVNVYGSKILYRGVHNGRRICSKESYYPTLFLLSKKNSITEYTSIHGEYLEKITPGNIRETKDFCAQYKDVSGFPIYGNQKYEYAYISDNFKNDIDWDIDHILRCNIDIEVGSENGFPDPAHASEPITAITIRNNNKNFIVFGCGEYKKHRSDVEYFKCSDEIELLQKFLTYWCSNYPDIITGWNVKGFDIPYIINRLIKVFGESVAKKFSPFEIYREREIDTNTGQKYITYVIYGIAVLDYMDLYLKYAPEGKSQESYKLDNIAHVELGERKLSYEEYISLHILYRENYQKFIEYNIRDVELVDLLEDKLKLIELALTLAYDSKCNYEDVFAQVRMWDSIIFNYFRKKKMVLPPIISHDKDAAYIGAYVKDPIIGLHKWIASFDLNSLYPHLIIQYNISPEMFIEPDDYTEDMRKILSNGVSVDSLLHQTTDLSLLEGKHITITPNGQFFKTNKRGFLPEIMENMYVTRSTYKNKAIEAKKELEKCKSDLEKKEIEKRIARFNNLQLAKKVGLNSAYGALGNQYFRFFDIRQASAITTSGQLSIRWIGNALNEYFNKLLNTQNEDFVIASDTDSVYLTFEKLISASVSSEKTSSEIIEIMDKICELKIQPFINKKFSDLADYVHAYEQKMVMKREALCDRGIWTAKKRYILRVYNNEGVQYAKPKVKISGLEVIKSSTPSACKDKLKEAIDQIFDTTENDLIQYISDFREKFKTLDIADISFPRGINNIQKYDSGGNSFGEKTPIHVRGAIVFNRMLKKKNLDKKYESIKDGDKIKFIYLKEPNNMQSKVIGFVNNIPVEFNVHQYIDYNEQFEKSFIKPLKIILDAIGWKTEKVSSLTSFFT